MEGVTTESELSDCDDSEDWKKRQKRNLKMDDPPRRRRHCRFGALPFVHAWMLPDGFRRDAVFGNDRLSGWIEARLNAPSGSLLPQSLHRIERGGAAGGEP